MHFRVEINRLCEIELFSSKCSLFAYLIVCHGTTKDTSVLGIIEIGLILLKNDENVIYATVSTPECQQITCLMFCTDQTVVIHGCVIAI